MCGSSEITREIIDDSLPPVSHSCFPFFSLSLCRFLEPKAMRNKKKNREKKKTTMMTDLFSVLPTCQNILEAQSFSRNDRLLIFSSYSSFIILHDIREINQPHFHQYIFFQMTYIFSHIISIKCILLKKS
jgi:hypothetical protein